MNATAARALGGKRRTQNHNKPEQQQVVSSPQAICHTSFPRYAPPRPFIFSPPPLRKVHQNREKVKEQFAGEKGMRNKKEKPSRQHLSKEWKMRLRLRAVPKKLRWANNSQRNASKRYEN